MTTSWEILIGLRDHVERHPELVQRVGITFRIRITDAGASWLVDLKNGRGAVLEGGDGGDCIVDIDERSFLELAAGADPGQLIALGRLAVTGDDRRLGELAVLQQVDPAQAGAAVARARAAGQGPGVPPSETVATPVRPPD